MAKVKYEIMDNDEGLVAQTIIELIHKGFLAGAGNGEKIIYGRYLTNKTTLKKLLEKSK